MSETETRRYALTRIAAPPDETPSAPADIGALLVIHGMGQQLRFATLDDVVEGLRRIDAIEGDVVARTITGADGDPLQRLEVPLKTRKRLDIYEAYWAPVTEGEVSVKDTVSFLVSG